MESETRPEDAPATAMEVDLAIRAHFGEGYVGVHRFCGVGDRQPAHIVDSAMLFALIEQNKKLLETANTCICSWCGLVGDKDPERMGRHMGECAGRQDAYETQKRADDAKVNAALAIAARSVGVDGAEHKQWVIDQMLRAILGDVAYVTWVEEYNEPADYVEWSEGIAP